MGEEDGTTSAAAPLKGIIICCTSISHDVRTEIQQKATDMGATWKQDLTSDATHLIVGDVNTPKYKYVAKQRPDVKPMSVSFIDVAHQHWMANESISIHELERDHIFPIFAGLKLCLTNINDEDQRHYIQKQAEKHGGSYHGDLTKQVTHLIAARAEGKKYEYAKQWQIKVVAMEWFMESLERGMALEEAYYSFDIPDSERGRGAWIRPTAEKRKLADREPSNILKSDPAKRKIKRAASDRLSSGSQDLWGSIMDQAKAPKPERQNEWAGEAPARAQSLKLDDSADKSNTMPPPEIPFVNVSTSISISELPGGKPKRMFHGVGFQVHGFPAEKETTIRGIIRSYDGSTFPSLQELLDASSQRCVIVVPDDFIQSDCPRVSDASKAIQIVTTWWVERCISAEKFVEPDEYQLGRPMKRHKVPGFEKLSVSVTGFDGVAYLHFKKAILALGAEFSDKFTKSRSLLISNSKNVLQKDKTNAAEAWKIPTVSQDWLLECAAEGEFVPFKKFLLNRSTPRDTLDEASKPKQDAGQNVLQGCNVKFDDAVKEDREKLEMAVVYMGGMVISSFNSEDPITHLITKHKDVAPPSNDLKKAWKIDGCRVATDHWLKICMKNKAKVPDTKYLVPKPTEILEDSIPKSNTTPKKGALKLGHDMATTKAELQTPRKESRITTPRKTPKHPFTIEGLDVIEEVAERLQPIHITPTKSSHARTSRFQKPANPGHSRTPTKKNADPPQTDDPVHPTRTEPKPPKGGSLLRNNLAEILKLSKQPQENESAEPPSKGPRKIQGRALSGGESLGLLNNSLSRSNSSNSNPNRFHQEDSEDIDSLRAIISSKNLDFGESMLYDSNRRFTPEPDVEPSQAIHYVDTEAELERKKLFAKLELSDHDNILKGRKIVQSTVAAVEMGGVSRRQTRQSKA